MKKNSQDQGQAKAQDSQLDLWEVFVQTGSHKNFEHAGAVHASDKEMAILNARDVFARREKVTGLWVVLSKNIVSTCPSEQGPMFHQSFDTPYRHPQFYTLPTKNRKSSE